METRILDTQMGTIETQKLHQALQEGLHMWALQRLECVSGYEWCVGPKVDIAVTPLALGSS